MYDGADIKLLIMKFTECQATGTTGGGGAIYAYEGTISLYAVEFSGNSAVTNNGDDICTMSAAVTIHTTCPQGEGGSPTVGERLLCQLAPRHFPTNQSPHPFLFASSHLLIRRCS